jgi:hypothetical protein
MITLSKPTLASITAGFTKQVAQLETLAEDSKSLGVTLGDQIDLLWDKQEEALATATTATKLAERIRAFTEV